MKWGLRTSQRLILVGLFVATFYVFAVSPGSTHGDEESKTDARKIVARVNGEPIFEEQLTPEVHAALRRFKKYGMRKQDASVINRFRKRALDKLIGQTLFREESRKLTVEDIDEKVKRKLDAVERKYGRGEQFEAYLNRSNLTAEGLKDAFEARVHADEYLRIQGISEPEISEESIKAAYEANPEGYSRKEAVKVSHILTRVDKDASDEEKQQARQKAEMIRGLIVENADFAETAKKFSDCNSASGGGDLRYIQRGYMPEEFEKVAFAIDKDTVSEVIETGFGYHILKVSDKQPAGVAPYETVRDFIKKYLQQEESKKKLEAHLAKLKEEARVEIFLTE